MSTIDFTTALARLLQSGSLRDQLLRDPFSVVAKMGLGNEDSRHLLDLDSEDLEQQAQVLLRKRLDAIRNIIPKTCKNMGDQSWILFVGYSRDFWPPSSAAAMEDAHAFCMQLISSVPEFIDRSEWNRLRFTFSQRKFAAHMIKANKHNSKAGLQIFFRTTPRCWREVLFHLRF